MNVLIACEESQRVCIEMRRLGHNAFSCDLLPCSGGHPEWHIQGDCLPLINGNCQFMDMRGGQHEIEGEWDLLIAHPPCTYLTVTANSWYDIGKYGDKARARYKERYAAIVFFMRFIDARCERIAVENPVGIMNTAYRKPDCIIQPYQFGEDARKATCLWLKGLPPLTPTNVIPFTVVMTGHSTDSPWHINTRGMKADERRRARSVTFYGIARAMGEQWAGKAES